MLALLKKQVPDPEIYNKMAGLLSDYKSYYTLSINTRNSASAFILDSVHMVDKVFLAGNAVSAIKDADNNFLSKGTFVGSVYIIKGTTSELKWDIGTETAVIGGFKCTKAMLVNSPDISVWFAPEIPVNSGPDFFYGLPGLVLKVETYFDETVAEKFSYSSDLTNFSTFSAKASEKIGSAKTSSLKEVIASRQNFIRMAEGKTKAKS
jgi:GLPGLI family protein